MELSQIINIDPDILWGIPVFKGTRVPIKNLFDYLDAGESLDDFLNDFDYIPKEACHIIISQHYAQMATEEADAIWDKKGLTDLDMDEWLNGK